MSRSVSAALEALLAAAVTTPGYLLEIDFSSPLRLCTRASLTFKGLAFIEWGFTVTGLQLASESAQRNASIQLFDPDRTITAFVLNETIEEKRVRLWAYYGDFAEGSAIDLHAPVPLFDGYGSDCRIDPSNGTVTLGLVLSAQRFAMTPRVRMTRELGFSRLPVDGQEYEFGGAKWKAEAE